MKRIAKRYYIAAVLLLLWAAADVYHYVTIGRELVPYYDGSGILQQLVHHSLFQGAVKALLGGLILFLGWRRGRKGAPVSSLTAVTALLVLVALGVWGAGMYCVTAVAAQHAAERYLTAYRDFASTLSTRSFYDWMGKGYDQEHANYDANRMWEAADSGRLGGYLPHIPCHGGGGQRLSGPAGQRPGLFRRRCLRRGGEPAGVRLGGLLLF